MQAYLASLSAYQTRDVTVLVPTEYEWGIGRVGGNHVSVWDALVFGFEQMGRACSKFGESPNFTPPLKFRTYCGSGVGW